jgi:CheY-like chemotaxis protein
VFCDIRMPNGMDGYAVARALRADRRTSRIHLVAISGRLTPTEERRAREAGFDGYACKPLSGGELAASLRRASVGQAAFDGTPNPRRRWDDPY